MGYLNQEHVYGNIPKLKDKECPICDGAIEVLESYYNENGTDGGFNYKCSICGPKVISIEGRVIATQEWQTWKKMDINAKLRFKIDNCTEKIVFINTIDFSSTML